METGRGFSTMGHSLSPEDIRNKNHSLREMREAGKDSEEFQKMFIEDLKNSEGTKAVTVMFTDLEGRTHSLDYRREFFLESHENLTFDGSSINGFTELGSSDLRLGVDWKSVRWAIDSVDGVPKYGEIPVFGPGKVLIFGTILNQDGSPYEDDMRGRLSGLCEDLRKKSQKLLIAPEIEGFLFEGRRAEQRFNELDGFDVDKTTSYFTSLPQDGLRIFIDTFSRVLDVMGFTMEKDHPEVAPGQFEVNWKYLEALDAADQVILYKLVARAIADGMGKTASFLPKPIAGENGSGMHTNISVKSEEKGNIFYDGEDRLKLSQEAKSFAAGVLEKGTDYCLAMNSSVNAYRRLDPNFEAPNALQMDSSDRGSVVRVPIGNEKSARIEVRAVAPDASPYLAWYLIGKAGLDGMKKQLEYQHPENPVILPGDIQTAIEVFRKSEFITKCLGEEAQAKFVELKEEAASMTPRKFAKTVAKGEVLYHHEVTNQHLMESY